VAVGGDGDRAGVQPGGVLDGEADGGQGGVERGPAKTGCSRTTLDAAEVGGSQPLDRRRRGDTAATAWP